MKKTVIAVLAAISLAGCNTGTRHLMPDYESGRHKFESIDVKDTTKQNTECDIYIPLLFTIGPLSSKSDTSIMSIAKEKNISNITYVDYQWKFILPFYMEKCYTVYGY
jgi:hypothetical protein